MVPFSCLHESKLTTLLFIRLRSSYIKVKCEKNATFKTLFPLKWCYRDSMTVLLLFGLLCLFYLKSVVSGGSSIKIVSSTVHRHTEIVASGEGYSVLDVFPWPRHDNGEGIARSDQISHSCHICVGLRIGWKHNSPIWKGRRKRIDDTATRKTWIPGVAKWIQGLSPSQGGKQDDNFKNMQRHSTKRHENLKPVRDYTAKCAERQSTCY